MSNWTFEDWKFGGGGGETYGKDSFSGSCSRGDSNVDTVGAAEEHLRELQSSTGILDRVRRNCIRQLRNNKQIRRPGLRLQERPVTGTSAGYDRIRRTLRQQAGRLVNREDVSGGQSA